MVIAPDDVVELLSLSTTRERNRTVDYLIVVLDDQNNSFAVGPFTDYSTAEDWRYRAEEHGMTTSGTLPRYEPSEIAFSDGRWYWIS